MEDRRAHGPYTPCPSCQCHTFTPSYEKVVLAHHLSPSGSLPAAHSQISVSRRRPLTLRRPRGLPWLSQAICRTRCSKISIVALIALCFVCVYVCGCIAGRSSLLACLLASLSLFSSSFGASARQMGGVGELVIQQESGDGFGMNVVFCVCSGRLGVETKSPSCAPVRRSEGS